MRTEPYSPLPWSASRECGTVVVHAADLSRVLVFSADAASEPSPDDLLYLMEAANHYSRLRVIVDRRGEQVRGLDGILTDMQQDSPAYQRGRADALKDVREGVNAVLASYAGVQSVVGLRLLGGVLDAAAARKTRGAVNAEAQP